MIFSNISKIKNYKRIFYWLLISFIKIQIILKTEGKMVLNVEY